ncbi:MAG: 5-methyltetrahydropteroyltriglutamate--homocysteine S-methyltransferase [Betaproteobacteria bacterium]|nr:5-methyltetrahydropteroyltriglutamate--homocysteine S-methyltransferase [Betaproteobacteria bacterium]
MSARTKPPFRADHVGSLLRSQKLKDAREAFKQGRLPGTALRAIEDEEVRRIVKRQEEAGLQAVTDGEFRRDYWYLDYMWQVGGVIKVDAGHVLRFRNNEGKVESPVPSFRVVGPLKSEQTIFGEDFAFLKSVTKAVPKMTIPSPSMMHLRGRASGIDEKVYPDMDKYREDLAVVYSAQIAALHELGCTYLQLDDTSWGFASDPAWRKNLVGHASPQGLLDTYADVVNAALANRPPGMTVCMHVCRGNFKSAWAAEGGYDEVADTLFNKVRVDAFFLEYDDVRSGSFAPLRLAPKDKTIVLGLVTSKTPALENKDDLKRRIDEATKYIALEQLCLSPQCGFASTIEGNRLTEDEQMAKLRLVVDTAREVWGT